MYSEVTEYKVRLETEFLVIVHLWNGKYYTCLLRIYNKSIWAEIIAGLKRVYNVIAQYTLAGTDSGMKFDEEDIKDNKIIIVCVLRKMCV